MAGQKNRSKSTVQMKLIDDKLKIIDDVPTSAVEMAVKEKVRLCIQLVAFIYNAAHPIVRQVLKMMILGIPLAVGPLLQLATAQAGTCNSQKKHNRT